MVSVQEGRVRREEGVQKDGIGCSTKAAMVMIVVVGGGGGECFVCTEYPNIRMVNTPTKKGREEWKAKVSS